MKLLEVMKSSIDDVSKLIFENSNKNILEVSVIRKGDGKDIVCVPTQTNCKMGCQFCHLTGIDLPVANLKSEEIEQLVFQSLKTSPKQNDTLLISYMGAGEPLFNINSVSNVCTSAFFIKQSTPFIGLGYKNIKFAVSTIIPNKNSFHEFRKTVKDWNLPMKLHWSLHSVSENRKTLMPKALDFIEGMELINWYADSTKQPVEIHYTLMENVNDREEDLSVFDVLINKDFPIKLLKFAENKTASELIGSDKTNEFKSSLEKLGFKVEIYSPPGRDINASCGQFLLRDYKRKKLEGVLQ